MTLVDDRPRLTPQADAEGWLVAFEAALQSRDAAAAAALFLADGLWRDVLVFTWNIQINVTVAPPSQEQRRFQC